LMAEWCLIAAVQLGGWQAYRGHLWCSLCSELRKHHYIDQKWEISLDCIKDAKNSCSLLKWIHQALVFAVIVFLKKWTQNKNALMKDDISIKKIMEWVRFSIIERNQANGIQPKIWGHKVRSSVYWQGMLEQKGLKWGLWYLN
jgi:hypothetical protein